MGKFIDKGNDGFRNAIASQYVDKTGPEGKRHTCKIERFADSGDRQ